MKRIYVDQIDGVDIPDEFKGRFYDKRKHKGRIKVCNCGNKYYDDSPRRTSKECISCRINKISSKNDVDPSIAIKNPRRNKHCNLCGFEFIDTSLACSRRYCIQCSAKYSYDVLQKFITINGVHQNSKNTGSDDLNRIKELYDGVKSDVQISKLTGFLPSYVRYLRVKLGLPTVSEDSRRILNGKLSINSLDEDKIKHAIVNRVSYRDLAEEYGVGIGTIKSKFRKLNLDRSSLIYLPIDISQEAIDVMIGHILGDGSLISVVDNKAAYFKVGHKITDSEYTKWSAEKLICLKPVIRQTRKYVDGRLFDFVSYTSIRTSTLSDWYRKFYDPSLREKFGYDGCKNPSIDIFKNLSDLSLAVWYMDDGTYDSGYPAIAMYFPAANYDEICEALTIRFNILFYHVNRKNIKLLKIRGASSRDKFFEIIKPYIHSRMTRKLPPSCRNDLSYSEDLLSNRFPTSKYKLLSDDDKLKFVDEVVDFVVGSDIPIRKLDQPVNLYLNDLQEELCRCFPKDDGSLPFKQNGLTYLDEICPHRFTSNHYGQISCVEAWKNSDIVRKAIMSTLSRDQPISCNIIFRRVMEMISAPGHFRPSGAAALLNKYKPRLVIDPFAGWCSRALACALNKYVKKYVGIDLQEPSVNAIRRILEDCQFMGGCHMNAVHGDTLEYMRNSNDKFDMILAGPPYFNTENYNGVVPNCSFAEWQETFVQPFSMLCAKLLNYGGVLALHIFDTHKFSFIEPFMFALKKAGLSHKMQYKFGIVKHLRRSQYIHIFGF
jgi:tRNA1(Val) A37 N6-methylase TrmN6